MPQLHVKLTEEEIQKLDAAAKNQCRSKSGVLRAFINSLSNGVCYTQASTEHGARSTEHGARSTEHGARSTEHGAPSKP